MVPISQSSPGRHQSCSAHVSMQHSAFTGPRPARRAPVMRGSGDARTQLPSWAGHVPSSRYPQRSQILQRLDDCDIFSEHGDHASRYAGRSGPSDQRQLHLQVLGWLLEAHLRLPVGALADLRTPGALQALLPRPTEEILKAVEVRSHHPHTRTAPCQPCPSLWSCLPSYHIA